MLQRYPYLDDIGTSFDERHDPFAGHDVALGDRDIGHPFLIVRTASTTWVPVVVSITKGPHQSHGASVRSAVSITLTYLQLADDRQGRAKRSGARSACRCP